MTFAQALEWYRANEDWLCAVAMTDTQAPALDLAVRALAIRKSWESMPYVPQKNRDEFVDAVMSLREIRGAARAEAP